MKTISTFVFLLLFLGANRIFAQQLTRPVIEWQKSLGGSRRDSALTVIKTFDHGFLVVGKSYSNDGNVTNHHGSTDSADAWVVKLDADGNLQWEHSYGGTGDDEFNHVIQCGNGDFICVGTTTSNDGDVNGLHGLADAWAVRINNNGNIMWSKVYGGSDLDHAQVIRKGVDGGYVMACEVLSNNGDVSNNHGWYDVWIIKIDEAGGLQWQKSFGTPNSEFPNSLTATSDNFYVVGGYSFYKGYPVCPIQNSTVYSEVYLKVDRYGNVVWENYPSLCGGPLGPSNYVSSLFEMPSGQLFLLGNHIDAFMTNLPNWTFYRVEPATGSRTPISIIPSDSVWVLYMERPISHTGAAISTLFPDSSILTCLSTYPGYYDYYDSKEGYLTRLSTTNGVRVLYKAHYGGSNSEIFKSLEALNELEYIAAGTSNSNDRDVSGNHGDYDFWVVKFSSLDKIKGHVFVDLNNNGIKEPNESYFSGLWVETVKGNQTLKSRTDADGLFVNEVDTGSYSTTVNLEKSYYNIHPAAKQSTFSAYNLKDSFDFGLVPIPGKKDLKIKLFPVDNIRPGSTAQYKIVYTNDGTETLNNVVVNMVKFSKTTFLSSVPTQNSILNDTISWNIGTLSPLASSTISITLKADPPPGISIGNSIKFSCSIEPLVNDETPLDNRDTLVQVVGGSFDPNSKDDDLAGVFPFDQLQTKSIDYTIQFQNTGTDTAFNIVIRDTLSAKLDSSSIQMISASHPYQLTIKEGNKLTWTFNDIKLLDSNHNEPASHGYITYSIKPKSNLVLGDTIKNTASIYFDFNLPEKTNTEITVLKLPPPPQPVVSGIASEYCSNQGVQKGKIINLPSANSGITVTAKLDGNPLSIASDSTFSFDVGTLSEGVHALLIAFVNPGGSDSLLQTFSIKTAVTPDVNVFANITNVTSLANPVVVTATNAAGGGTSPLYTFAQDRMFNTILQAEGNSNTLTLNPANLLVGDNWIYVRMKTSLSCYATQTNIDSILLRRDAVTGIIDVDDPGRIINIYPNPFNRQFNINGLNPMKQYEITLVDLNGKQILKKQIQNATQLNLTLRSYSTGIYLLNLFDKQKQRLIGSVRLVKQ